MQIVRAIQIIDSEGYILATDQGRWNDEATASDRARGYHPELFTGRAVTSEEMHDTTLLITVR